MSVTTPIRNRPVTSKLSSFPQKTGRVLIDFAQVEDSESLVWRQIDYILRQSFETPSTQRSGQSERIKYSQVAPGIIVKEDEYAQRYAGIDLDRLRQRMSPELFKVFVRHIGSIPGHPDLEISRITVIPD